jgi:large subunit ribosomal protein L10
MPSIKNQNELAELQEKVDKSTAMYVVDYQGLTHQQLEEARRELGDNGAEIAVAKNTLMNIALKAKDIDVADQLQGPTATLFAYEDGITAARILKEFNKKYDLPKIKFGIFEGKVVTTENILAIANLPTKDVLLAKLLGGMNAPISGFVYVLNANISKLAQVLKAIEEKKQGEATN